MLQDLVRDFVCQERLRESPRKGVLRRFEARFLRLRLSVSLAVVPIMVLCSNPALVCLACANTLSTLCTVRALIVAKPGVDR